MKTINYFFLKSSSGAGRLKNMACHFVVTESVCLWTFQPSPCRSVYPDVRLDSLSYPLQYCKFFH